MGGERRDGVGVMEKYIEYNAIVVLVLVIGGASIGEGRRGLSVKYRMLRGMIRIVVRLRGGGIGK